MLRREALIGAALVALVVGIYAQTAGFEFVRFDDQSYILTDPIREGITLRGARWAFAAPHAANYLPLTWLSHMLDVELYGFESGWHHVTNVVLHALNTVLLFAALRFMTGAVGASVLVAALFAAHPLNVESVAWVAERKNLLSTSFWILAMWVYADWTRRGGWGRYLAVAALLAAGLLAKSMLVTLPLVLLLLDYWPLDRVRRWPASPPADGSASPAAAPGAGVRRSIAALVAEKLPLLAISAAASAATLYSQEAAMSTAEQVAPEQRLATALVSYARYLGKLVWPSDLALLYPHPYMPTVGGTPPATWQIGAAAALLAVLTAGALFATRRRYLVVGWLWFLGTLVPTIGLVQVGLQGMADRYMYVPAIGLFIALAWSGSDALVRLRGRRSTPWAASGAVGAVVLLLASVAWVQTAYWRDSFTLFEHSVAVTGRNPKLRFNLANAYRARGELDAAIANYRITLETDPDAIKTRINLGNVLRAVGDLAGAEAEYRRAIEIDPDHATAHNNLATVLRLQGRVDEAASLYRAALALRPGFGRAHYNLANLLRSRGELEEAVSHYRAALETLSADARVHNNLGATLQALGRVDEAIEAYHAALVVSPDHARAHNNVGLLLAATGDLDSAIRHYRSAVEAEPGYARAYSNLGDALWLGGRLDAAIAAYRSALEADPRLAIARVNLERALAEAATSAQEGAQ